MDGFCTKRLIAEPLQDGHFDHLKNLHLDPQVSRYLGGVRTPEVTRAYLRTNLDHWTRHGFGLWVMRTKDGAFVGRAGLRHIDIAGADEVEVAYTFARDAWGQGYASEITQALVQIGFGPLALPSIVGVVVEAHAASCRVLEKSGFSFERMVTLHGEACRSYRMSAPIAIGE